MKIKMMKKHRPILALLTLTILALAFLRPTFQVQAAPLAECAPFDENGYPKRQNECMCSNDPNSATFCMNISEFVMVFFIDKINVALLSLQELFARWYWLVARLVAGLAESLMEGETWQWVRDELLQFLRQTVGGSGDRRSHADDHHPDDGARDRIAPLRPGRPPHPARDLRDGLLLGNQRQRLPPEVGRRAVRVG